ncbi:Ig-like domain-containing protein [Ectobacillus ponti]|uniref:Ig-like domain-containing protein n=1 Tax=Ectobacillus ponti TaxID=2961894 RepID=A0AA41X814_9BACI|nr:Ig-like domain-containing protein [Ectobacillus ponti]MCP8967988.1 Ig-like domain-containing protein [Ectobacillus ponti]
MKKAAIITSLSLLTSTLVPEGTQAATSAPAAWPAAFKVYTKNGQPIVDVEGDVSPSASDLSHGGKNLPTVYYASDNTNVFFRIRVKGDPYDRKGGFTSTAWLVDLGVNNQIVAAVGIDGKGTAEDDVYVSDPSGTETKVYATDSTGSSVPGTRIVPDGNGQYFIDFQVPIAAIKQAYPAFTPSTPVQLFFGSSQAANLSTINKDYMSGSAVDFTGLLNVSFKSDIVISGGEQRTVSTSHPTISGTTSIADGRQATVTIDGHTYTATVQNGQWSINVAHDLANGTYPVTVTATDEFGNTVSDTQTLVCRTVKIAVTSAAATNDATPTITGTTDAADGSTVSVSVNGKNYSATVSAGKWSVTLPDADALADGTYTVAAAVTEAGTGITATTSQQLAVDTNVAVAITAPKNGAFLKTRRPALTGTVDAAATVKVQLNNGAWADAAVTGTTWTYTPAADLADGAYAVAVEATDSLGNKAKATSTFIVDTATTVTIAGPTGTIRDKKPAITGTAEEGATVEISLDKGVSWTRVPYTGTTWSYTPAADLADGAHEVQVRAEDAAGNKDSKISTFMVDTATTVTIAGPTGTIRDKQPAITGTAEEGGTVEISLDGGVSWARVLYTGTTWSYTPAADLADGAHEIKVHAEDAAGNETSKTSTFTVDTATTVTIAGPAGTIRDKQPAITGTAEEGATVEISLDGGTSWTNVPYTGISWSYTPSTDLTDGAHEVQVRTVDAAGNKDSKTSTFAVDTETTVSISGPANGATVATKRPELTGTNEKGAAVKLQLNDGSWADATVDGTNWTYTPTADLADGSYTVAAEATDSLGNKQKTSSQFTVDTVTAVTIDAPANHVVVNDKKPVISGTAEMGAAVEISVDGGDWTAVAQDGVSWTYKPASDLGQGEHKVEVRSKDAAGNTDSQTSKFVVDTETTVSISAPANGSSSVEKAPSMTGKAEADSLVEVQIDDSNWVKASVDGILWTYKPANLSVGNHTLKVRTTDAVGNKGEATSQFTVEARPVSIEIDGGDKVETTDATPLLSGATTAEDGRMVTLSIVDGENKVVRTLNSTVTNGKWNIPVGNALSAGTYKVRTSVTNEDGAVGNDEQTLVLGYRGADLKLATSNPSLIGDGRSKSEITATLLDKSGKPIVGERVTFAAEAGTLSKTEAVTDENGRATVVLTAPNMNGTLTPATKLVKVAVNNEENLLSEEGNIEIHFEPAVLKGQIVDSVTKKPLGGSVITIKEDFNKDGKIDFETVVTADPEGNYEIAVPYGDWNYSLHVQTNIVVDGTSVPVEFVQDGEVGTLSGGTEKVAAEQTLSVPVLFADPNTGKPESLKETFGSGNVTIQPTVLNDPDGTLQVVVQDTGTLKITGGEPGQTYDVVLNIVADGQTLVGKKLHVQIPKDGVAAVQAELIDPYGTVTDAATHKIIQGAEVKLYWADTALNRGKQRPVNQLVNLPILDGFAPNQNKDPQITDKAGQYAWMVFPDADYYVVAEKDGYVVYDSRNEKRDVSEKPGEDSYITDGVIHVGQTIVNYDFEMNQPEKAALTVADQSLQTKVNTAVQGHANKPADQAGSLQYAVGKKPAHGTVEVKEDGSYTYKPELNYAGTDSFTVVVTNAEGQTGTGIVKINVERNVLKLRDQTVDLGTGSDISGKIEGEGLDAAGLVYDIVAQPKHGTVTISQDGTWKYHKTGSYEGQDMFRMRVKDATGAIVTAAVYLNMKQAETAPIVAELPKTGSPLDRSLLLALASLFTLGGFTLRGRKRTSKK